MDRDQTTRDLFPALVVQLCRETSGTPSIDESDYAVDAPTATSSPTLRLLVGCTLQSQESAVPRAGPILQYPTSVSLDPLSLFVSMHMC